MLWACCRVESLAQIMTKTSCKAAGEVPGKLAHRPSACWIHLSGFAAKQDFRSLGSIISSARAPYLAPKHLVLLPGLDGTGELFVDFIAALPESLSTTTVTYPTDRFLPYAELHPFVASAVPQSEPFVMVAESFSAPLAVLYAATNPRKLAAIVVCAGFVSNPVRVWSGTLKALAKPWLFGLRPPRTILEYFLLGPHAPVDLLQRLRHALERVSPHILSGRVREVLDCDARDDLLRTAVPLLYLEATRDRLLSSSCKNEFSQLRPDTVVRSIDAPHLLLQREPQKAANIILTFITGLPSSPD
jgi:pimeloyl-[acyl-carrier protein] methyl ester esterase